MSPHRAPLARLAAALAGAACASSGATAADERIGVEQINPAVRADATAPAQAGGRSQPLPPAQAGPADRTPQAASQIAPAERSPGASPQLSRAGDGARTAPQLAVEKRTADGARAISTPAQGRTGAVARIAGSDACDPKAAGAKGAKVDCEAILERRAEEFARPPPPPPSPEEQLLAFQRRAGGGSDARVAVRKLAEGEVEDSIAAQATAQATLAPEEPPAQKSPAGQLSPEAQAVVEAIAKGVIVTR